MEKVAYICDGKACPNKPDGCQNICVHTTDVRHAVNFDLMDDGSGYWAEKMPDGTFGPWDES